MLIHSSHEQTPNDVERLVIAKVNDAVNIVPASCLRPLFCSDNILSFSTVTFMFKTAVRFASNTMSAQARTAPYTRAVVAAMRRL